MMFKGNGVLLALMVFLIFLQYVIDWGPGWHALDDPCSYRTSFVAGAGDNLYLREIYLKTALKHEPFTYLSGDWHH
jgi:hypothetical protein